MMKTTDWNERPEILPDGWFRVGPDGNEYPVQGFPLRPGEDPERAVQNCFPGQKVFFRQPPMKPYIVLVGTAYEGAGWDDYAGSAGTIEEAEAIVQRKVAEQGWLTREAYFFHIVDLRTMKIVKRG